MHTGILRRRLGLGLQSELMRWQMHGLLLLLALTMPGMAWGQQSQPPSNAPAKAPAKKAPAAQAAPNRAPEADPQDAPSGKVDPEAELQLAVTSAGNDNAALVKNLEAYLVRYPDSPRRLAIYRGIMQSGVQGHNDQQALDYAQKILTIEADDTQTMYVAATILEHMPDDASLNRALDYDSRLITSVAKADPDSRPNNMTLDDWQAGRNRFLMNLYNMRGRMERHLHKNDDAVKDFTSGFHIMPGAEGALDLGEIAEEQKHPDEALRQYAAAFFLAGLDPDDNAVSRDSLRLRAFMWVPKDRLPADGAHLAF